MSRDPQDVRATMAALAGLTAYDADHTWRDVLFEASPSPAFTRPDDPDRALLGALAEEYPELDRHGDGLPERAHLAWLERILAIPRLPVVPDHVVAGATVDPKLAPAVITQGTTLRGGKDAAGAERRYTTDDVLTAHGATVTAVRSLVPGGDPDGLPGRVAEAAPFPLAPGGGADAPHTLRLHSPVLAFEGGTMGIRLRFEGAVSASGLLHASWRYPRPDGTVGLATTGAVAGDQVSVLLAVGCGVAAGDPWLEAVIPADRPVPTALTFTRAWLQVTSRSAIVPQAAYLNDGALDVTKEFQPYGAVARRGDALYLRSDEAFGKPLSSVTVSIQVMQEGGSTLYSSAGGSGIPDDVMTVMSSEVSYLQGAWSSADEAPEGVLEALENLAAIIGTSSDPRVVWQRRVDGEWQTFRDVGARLTGFAAAPVSGTVCSETAVVGGQPGHLIRAFLSAGDFGWTAYQAAIAAFATGAVGGSKPTMPVPPVPPVVSRVTLSYTTSSVQATRVEAVNGWAHTVATGTGPFSPFTRTVSSAGETGMVALGLELPDGAIGSSVSVHLEVESASPCGSSVDPDARWQWWDGALWQPLPVADGSRLLRESGLLRFVAPSGWAVGCSDTGAGTGRWLRMVTTAPERIGAVTAVSPDAVLATFVSSATDPARDPSPATALPPGTIKGTLTPIPGVKKVTNLTGIRGRGPEENPDYRRRASALARHRSRAITAWDYEEIVAVAFAEVAAVRCLPHTGSDGTTEPGAVGLVVVPDRPLDPAPRPSVSLAGRITDVLAPMTPLHATPVVICPIYVPVSVTATIILRRGFAALTGKNAITTALETWLHPTGTTPTRWGRSLYRSSLEAFLDGLPEVDSVESVQMSGPGGDVEVLTVEACRGLYCSSRAHTFAVQEQL